MLASNLGMPLLNLIVAFLNEISNDSYYVAITPWWGNTLSALAIIDEFIMILNMKKIDDS